ncbi:MAG: LapA family protein [Deltaproteobacteria bacterium]|nr:LapA family protein [Deltaproteobacteria bacterium]
MRFFLVIAIILVALAASFALQNAQPVSVKFIKWSFEASLVIVLILTFAAGALAAFLISVPWRIRVLRELSGLKKTNKDKSPQ